jgi:hypothetical protein
VLIKKKLDINISQQIAKFKAGTKNNIPASTGNDNNKRIAVT